MRPGRSLPGHAERRFRTCSPTRSVPGWDDHQGSVAAILVEALLPGDGRSAEGTNKQPVQRVTDGELHLVVARAGGGEAGDVDYEDDAVLRIAAGPLAVGRTVDPGGARRARVSFAATTVQASSMASTATASPDVTRTTVQTAIMITGFRVQHQSVSRSVLSQQFAKVMRSRPPPGTSRPACASIRRSMSWRGSPEASLTARHGRARAYFRLPGARPRRPGRIDRRCR